MFDVQWIIRLALAKALVDEERVNMVVPHLQQLLEHVQFLFYFAHKVFFSLLYEPLQLIHISTSNITLKLLSLCPFGGYPNPWLFILWGCLYGDELGHKGKEFAKIHSVHSITTNYVLCLTILPNASPLVQKTHVHLTLLRSFQMLVNSHKLLAKSAISKGLVVALPPCSETQPYVVLSLMHASQSNKDMW